ncbi:MAG: SDR family NAD(P)-dependent oxidoreductase, partial [Dactylosporangium sp.]|nr:SDR family NAD(P)-dependent oxidoreductase [Dactylosporangium sp.]NNJ59667.1 SDR family NAD(P)-dependent oxidoreductase [Dactylosporangium sp.]
ALDRAGLRYGPSFQGIDHLWRGDGAAIAQLRDPADLIAGADRNGYLVHPALLDSCLQALSGALDPADPADPRTTTYLPVGVGRFTVLAERAVPRWALAVCGAPDPAEHEISGGRVVLFDAAGDRVGEIGGMTLRRLELPGAQDPVSESLLAVGWEAAADDPDRKHPAADAGAGWWLLFADLGGVCHELRSMLADGGGAGVTVTAGERYRRLDQDHYEIDPSRMEDVAALLAELRQTRPAPCAGVVHAWSLDAELAEDGEPGPPAASPDHACVSVLHLVQALARAGWNATPRLVLVTRGVHRVGAEEAPPAVAQSAMWGLARVLAMEHGELRPAIVDLDPDLGGEEARCLFDELLRADRDEQLVLRGGQRYVPRLGPWNPPEPADGAWARRPLDAGAGGNHRILAVRPGSLDSLTPVLWQRARPGPGQVEIEIAAAGLNFSDVLKAMDVYPGLPPGVVALGAECAGRVVAVGEGVDGHPVGEAVLAVAPSSMAGFATTSAQLVAPKPRALSVEQAAGTPIAFLTAVYGLEHLAHLATGETVLIHSATGGVGLAALQVARRNGAEVFATAGTEEKRELLRRLGVRHVMDSRSLRFADEVRDLTAGRGVDVVLNSLSGEALTRSLSLLAPNGRFVEIGKQDIHRNSHLGMELFKHNRSLFAVDLEHSIADRPDLIAGLLREVVRGFDTGDFTALPVTSFPYSAAAEAFGQLARARHTGKIVLRAERPAAVAVPPGGHPVRAEATYLITGGLGALGRETARYLVDQGARHLALLGRHGPPADAGAVLDELRSLGAEIRVHRADVSRFDDVTRVLADIDASMPPLAGVIHAAGVLDDGLLLELDQERFRGVTAPKVAGAWHLHRATMGRDLDFMVLFSSAAALLGSPSQGNYAAANAFLDSLAVYRRWLGLPGLSINWGPWSEIGLAARPDRGGALSAFGIASVRPDAGIAALDRLLPTSTAQACVLPLDREKLRVAAESGLLPRLLTSLRDRPDTRSAEGRQRSTDIRRKLLAVEPGRRRTAMLTQHCTATVARVLKLDESRVDPTTPLANMGFDSLMSLELRKRLETSLDVELLATVVWRFPTIEVLVPFLAERMGIALAADPAAGSAPAGGDSPPDADRERPAEDGAADLGRLSASELESLLVAKMTQMSERGLG